MADDANRVIVLKTVPDEAEAALIVAALEDRGIQARRTGEMGSHFRGYAPGEVQILVRQADLERAREALRAIEAGGANTD